MEDLARLSLKHSPLYVGVDDHKETATVEGLQQVGRGGEDEGVSGVRRGRHVVLTAPDECVEWQCSKRGDESERSLG